MWAVPVAVCWVVVVSLLIRLSFGFLMVVPVSVVAGYGVDVYVFRADRTVPQFLHGQISWRCPAGHQSCEVGECRCRCVVWSVYRSVVIVCCVGEQVLVYMLL